MGRLPKLKPDPNRKYSSLCLSHDLQNQFKSYNENEAMTDPISLWFNCWRISENLQ